MRNKSKSPYPLLAHQATVDVVDRQVRLGRVSGRRSNHGRRTVIVRIVEGVSLERLLILLEVQVVQMVVMREQMVHPLAGVVGLGGDGHGLELVLELLVALLLEVIGQDQLVLLVTNVVVVQRMARLAWVGGAAGRRQELVLALHFPLVAPDFVVDILALDDDVLVLVFDLGLDVRGLGSAAVQLENQQVELVRALAEHGVVAQRIQHRMVVLVARRAEHPLQRQLAEQRGHQERTPQLLGARVLVQHVPVARLVELPLRRLLLLLLNRLPLLVPVPPAKLTCVVDGLLVTVGNDDAKAVVPREIRNEIVQVLARMEMVLRNGPRDEIPLVGDGVLVHRIDLQSLQDHRLRDLDVVLAIVMDRVLVVQRLRCLLGNLQLCLEMVVEMVVFVFVFERGMVAVVVRGDLVFHDQEQLFIDVGCVVFDVAHGGIAGEGCVGLNSRSRVVLVE